MKNVISGLAVLFYIFYSVATLLSEERMKNKLFEMLSKQS